MKFSPQFIAFGFSFFAAFVTLHAQVSEPSALAHVRTEFEFTVDAPFERTAPLFGADEERKWAPDWNPQFIYPTLGQDQPGMVFRVAHGQFSSIWINTAYDLVVGHVQYAYVLNDAMTTLIDIHLARKSADKTVVTVIYERTALEPEANDHVQHFAKADAGAAKQWAEQINAYIAKGHAAATPAKQ